MTLLAALIARHGSWLVGLTVGVESMGLPLPGETVLVTAAIYAGATHRLSIIAIIMAAIAGAIIGDNLGYLIGRRFGYPLLLRYGGVVQITTSRIKVGRLLFLRHGGKVVFLGRFIAVLRTFAGLLAGVNCMPWARFLFFNAAGAVAWAGGYGLLAYQFGRRVEEFRRPVAITVIAIAIAVVGLLIRFIRRHEARFQAEAEVLFPGPLQA